MTRSTADTRRDASHRWPPAIYDHGVEPDPRFSLANERTFLAWIRTSLALLAGATAVHALDLSVPVWLSTLLAVLLAVTGLICAVQAWRGWSRVERALRLGDPLPGGPSRAVVAVGVAAVGLVLVALIITATATGG